MTDPVPDSPEALLALQRLGRARDGAAAAFTSAKLRRVLTLIEKLDIGALECLHIAMAQVQRLEKFHDAVVAELDTDERAPHSLIARWAIDADRLHRARRLLESVELE